MKFLLFHSSILKPRLHLRPENINNNNNNNNFTFQPIEVENLGAFSLLKLEFLSDLSHKLSSFSGEERASSFLFQRLSVSLQCFNSVPVHDTFMIDDVPDQ